MYLGTPLYVSEFSSNQLFTLLLGSHSKPVLPCYLFFIGLIEVVHSNKVIAPWYGIRVITLTIGT